MKRDEWKQPTPHMQLKAVLMGAQGYVDNLREGISSPGSLPALQDLLEQAQELAGLVHGTWPQPEWRPIPDYGDRIPAAQWTAPGGDYGYDDGSGYWATDTEMSRVNCHSEKPDWATQVIWFNK